MRTVSRSAIESTHRKWRPTAMSPPAGPITCVTESRSEEHTSELQSLRHLVCRLLLEKKKTHCAHQYYVIHTTPMRTGNLTALMPVLLFACPRLASPPGRVPIAAQHRGNPVLSTPLHL